MERRFEHHRVNKFGEVSVMARPTNPDIRALRDRLMRRALRLTSSKADAEDLVQDVMLKIVDKAPDLPMEQMIRWSLVVMRNAHITICTAGPTQVMKSSIELDDQPELAIDGPQEAAVFMSETLRILTTLGLRFQGAIEAAVLGTDGDMQEGSPITRRTTLLRARAALTERLNSSKKVAA